MPHPPSGPRRRTLVVAALIASAGCRLHEVVHDPLPPMAVPDQWQGATAAGAALPERWWQALGDPGLDQLVDEVLAGNLPLRAAWARVRQARALVRQADATRWPQLDVTGQAARTRQRFEIMEGVVLTPTVNSFQLSAAAGYEVDLWRRLGSTRAAAALDALAVRDDAEAIATSVVGEVAEAWFDVVAVKAQLAILADQGRINATFLELTELRFRTGTATALDVYQQRQQVLANRAAVEQAEGALRAAGTRLAVLRGVAPGDPGWIERAPAQLPTLPATPALGVPADLLRRGPDVRAARRRAEAADHRVGVALADRFPALRLGGSVGLSASSITKLFDGGVFSVFAQVAQSVFDGGRRAAEVERTRDVVDERLLGLAQVLVAAMAEVDGALTDERNRAVELATTRERRALAQAALDDARAFYAEGLIDYLQVLNALAAQQTLQLAELQQQRTQLSARLRLYRALGGTWTQTLTVPGRATRN
ncbi:MAG: efflux transporter outer membrane subunit [Kofleriaceae bacterium]